MLNLWRKAGFTVQMPSLPSPLDSLMEYPDSLYQRDCYLRQVSCIRNSYMSLSSSWGLCSILPFWVFTGSGLGHLPLSSLLCWSVDLSGLLHLSAALPATVGFTTCTSFSGSTGSVTL